MGIKRIFRESGSRSMSRLTDFAPVLPSLVSFRKTFGAVSFTVSPTQSCFASRTQTPCESSLFAITVAVRALVFAADRGDGEKLTYDAVSPTNGFNEAMV